MSREDSALWRGRAEQLRALGETMEAGIARQVVFRIAEDYELFAQSIEQRPNRFLPPEGVDPLEVKQDGDHTRTAEQDASLVPDQDLPDLVKPRPA
jgi:hypothetical protein